MPGLAHKLPEAIILPNRLGKTGLEIPPLIFGTSSLGNLYRELPWDTKLEILQEIFVHMPQTVVLDSAGKYGAGLALEVMGKGLRELNIPPERVLFSNKLGWYRVPLTTAEPTFEPGAWFGLQHDAEQRISYDGILQCWEQGCFLLGEKYMPQLVSVHDPDEYLAQAKNPTERQERLNDILLAYKALTELREQGVVKAVGVGAKDWRVIREIVDKVDLDWVMLALSLTIYHHPRELLEFVEKLQRRDIGIINSAVFHAGFFTGGRYFDYRIPDPNSQQDQLLFQWRDRFLQVCHEFQINPADACVQFGLSHPAVTAVALNTSKPQRIAENVRSVSVAVPGDFWQRLKELKLIEKNYPYLDE